MEMAQKLMGTWWGQDFSSQNPHQTAPPEETPSFLTFMNIYTHSIYKTQNICVCVLRQTLVYVALAWLPWRLHSAFVELESKPCTCQSSYTFTTKTFALVFCIIFEFYIRVLDIQKAVCHFFIATLSILVIIICWGTSIWTMDRVHPTKSNILKIYFVTSHILVQTKAFYL